MTYYQNPYYGYYPMAIQQPMMYPQQQVVEQPQTNTNGQITNNESYMTWVQGKAGAQSYPVARGTTLPLFDTEGDYLYIKSVDANGVPLPLVTKVISDPPVEVKAEVIETSPQMDMSAYVTKEAYDEMKKRYDDLEMRILELETKPTSTFSSTFTGNTFNNTKKGGENESKLTF